MLLSLMVISMLNILSDSEIKSRLIYKAPVITVDKTGSTNSDLKKLAEEGADEWTLLCADSQTEGRGRIGNTFYSPKNGIYMSILLRPEILPQESLYITSIAGCSVCRAIEKLTDKKVKIKWVNDLYNEQGKVCGILSESSIDFTRNKLDYVILGIGINLFPPQGGFPKEICEKASSLFLENEKNINIKNHLISEIFNQVYGMFNIFDTNEIGKEYKERSLLIGKQVTYFQNNKEFTCKVIDIDNKCRLIVSDIDGNIIKLSSGEVKIKTW